MDTISKIKNALKRAGLHFKAVQLINPDRRGLMIYHDYSGYYPTREAIAAHTAAERIAAKYNAHSEERGHYTATLIII